MKKIYKYPETEIVFVGLSKLIMQNGEGENSGDIGEQDDPIQGGILTNENKIFEDDSPGKSSLWD